MRHWKLASSRAREYWHPNAPCFVASSGNLDDGAAASTGTYAYTHHGNLNEFIGNYALDRMTLHFCTLRSADRLAKFIAFACTASVRP